METNLHPNCKCSKLEKSVPWFVNQGLLYAFITLRIFHNVSVTIKKNWTNQTKIANLSNSTCISNYLELTPLQSHLQQDLLLSRLTQKLSRMTWVDRRCEITELLSWLSLQQSYVLLSSSPRAAARAPNEDWPPCYFLKFIKFFLPKSSNCFT